MLIEDVYRLLEVIRSIIINDYLVVRSRLIDNLHNDMKPIGTQVTEESSL